MSGDVSHWRLGERYPSFARTATTGSAHAWRQGAGLLERKWLTRRPALLKGVAWLFGVGPAMTLLDGEQFGRSRRHLAPALRRSVQPHLVLERAERLTASI
jgi:hypothetical protein